MSPLLTLCLSLLVLVGSCAAPSGPAPQKGPWSVQLNTSGGFVGIGRGNLTVNSDGKFKYEEPSRPEARKGCEGKWSGRQLESISDAVAKSQPDLWNKPGLDIAAPDAFGYKLELRTGSEGRTFTVKWYDNTADKLPEDLKQLSDTLLQKMSTACKSPSS